MKILACSSTRSDYDLMSSLLFRLDQDQNIKLKLLISGTHLSPSRGNDISQIESDGFGILLKVESLIDGDSPVTRVKSAGILLQGSVDIINQFAPDLIIYAGDREDVLIYSMIGGYLRIPTLHLYGGDHVFDGYIDNPIRHACSKLSTVHFVTLEEHKKRLICMGEKKERIFTVGNLSIDNLHNTKYLNRNEIANYLSIDELPINYAILIYHPTSAELENIENIFKFMLDALQKMNIFGFVSYPNTDEGNTKIVNIIKEYEKTGKFYFYKNLPRKIFLSLYKNTKLIIGNSSSGIMEAATFKIPAINVGKRQQGRRTGKNVVFCDAKYKKIVEAIKIVCSKDFKNNIKDIENIYGDGKSTDKAYELIKNIDFNNLLLKKEDPLEVNYD